MKKIKTIGFRLSVKDYDIMYKDYLKLKHNPEWTKLIYRQSIKSFSDYVRLMITIGMNE